ncbi:MAG: hypothetical protein JEZ12_14895 [Desulfobacterium sp.]|nr:hypothetical protein [Desulfobacterium sp.]
MTKKNKKAQKTDAQRTMALKALPPHIREQLTEEETELFLNGEEWPESMFEKLGEFIIPEE